MQAVRNINSFIKEVAKYTTIVAKKNGLAVLYDVFVFPEKHLIATVKISPPIKHAESNDVVIDAKLMNPVDVEDDLFSSLFMDQAGWWEVRHAALMMGINRAKTDYRFSNGSRLLKLKFMVKVKS